MIGRLGLLVFLCLWLGHEPAAKADLPRALFAIKDVPVDVTSTSLVHARETAIADAQSAAVQRLMRRFVPESEMSRLGGFTPADIERLVAGVEVAEEKNAGTRYVGSITVVFRPDEVKQRLKASGVAYSMTLARPVLVLPQAEERETAQAWRAAFEKLPRGAWLESFVLPNAEGDGDLPTLAHANRVDQIATARLVPEMPPSPGMPIPGVSVALQLYGQPSADVAGANLAVSALTETLHVAREPLDTNETLFARAAAQVMERINEPWIRATAETAVSQSTTSVRASFDSFSDWLALRDVLSSVSNIIKVDVSELSVSSALLDLTISGTPDKLAFALAQRDLKLQTDGQPWRIARDTRK